MSAEMTAGEKSVGLQSMTGFARSETETARARLVWELRSVNGKGLDIRLRLPSGLERLEQQCRQQISAGIQRGNIQAVLSLTVTEARQQAILNRDVLDSVLALRRELGDIVDPAPLRLNELLSIRGLFEIREPAEDEDELAARDAAILQSLDGALAALGEMRRREGAELALTLRSQLRRIGELAAIIDADPSRRPQAIAEKLSQQLALLLEGAAGLDAARLNAELALLATRADLREEIDRLRAHVSAAGELIAAGGAIGRKLDFLAQEFNREANTICSKSNAGAVSAAGIELKVVIDQFREQVQNLE